MVVSELPGGDQTHTFHFSTPSFSLFRKSFDLQVSISDSIPIRHSGMGGFRLH